MTTAAELHDLDWQKSVSERHRTALMWFEKHAGEEVGWPGPLNGDILLVTRAKGIYKPEGSRYALSVREVLDGPYLDREPVYRPDGSWSFAYFQENPDPARRDDEYTNLALMACMEDGIPVGVLRQTQGRPDVRYRVLGLAYVTEWTNGYFILEGLVPNAPHPLSRRNDPAHMLATQEALYEDETEGPEDQRERVIAEIVRRRGQPAFRKSLLEAYEQKCAITGCSAPAALEACHIVPYRGEHSHQVRNGILLRADVHTLFDLGLIAIDPQTMTVITSEGLEGTEYGELRGRVLRLPMNAELHPAEELLRAHREQAGL